LANNVGKAQQAKKNKNQVMLQTSASFDQLGHGKLWPSRRLAVLQFKKKGLGRPSVFFLVFLI
jgi:hypothetical protein